MNKSIYKPIEEVVEPLIDAYGEDVYKMAFFYVRNQKLTESIFQDVFFKAMKYYSRSQQDHNQKIWLMRTTMHICRKAITGSSLLSYLNVYKNKQNQTNDTFLMQLPPKQREVIILTFYGNFTIEEAEVILKIPKGSISIEEIKQLNPQIKETLEIEIDPITYRPELKVKTLNYIKAKSHSIFEDYPINLKQFSIITGITFLLGIGILINYAAKKPDDLPLDSVNIPVSSRQISQPLSETLDQLGLEYQQQVTIFEEQNLMNSYIIEGLAGYEIEFSSFLYQIDVCEEVEKILTHHGVDERSFNLIKLGKSRVFVYKEMPHLLLEYLNVEEESLYCLY